MCMIAVLLVLQWGCSTSMDRLEDSGFFIPKDPPAAQYTLDAQLGITERTARMEAEGSIVFRNPSKQLMSIIALEWSTNPNNNLEVFLDGEMLLKTYPNPTQQTIHFYALPRGYKPNEKIELRIRYNLEFTTGKNGDISLRRWYPKLWWDDLPTRDPFRVKLDVPEDYITAASGRLNASTGYYENPGVTTSFGLWLSKDVMVEERDSGGVLVRALFTEAGKTCAMLCLETAVDVIRFYQQSLRIFPFESLTIIPGASRPMGGYPFASALVVIHGQQAFDKRPELHWKWITAHEIGHQYWGEYIMSNDTPDDYTESWLMIGMGIFADRMYVESRGLGDEKHQNFFNRFTAGLKKYYDTTADATESLRSQQQFDRNNVLIHGKGYSIVSALRSVLGDETFKRVYLRCINEYGGKRLSYRDFWDMAEEESGKNLHWFFQQWVRSPKYLCYQIVSTETRKEGEDFFTEITVEPKGDSLYMPVDLKAVFADGTHQTARINRFSKKVKITFRSESEFKEAELDPLQRLAMLDKPVPVLPKELPARVRKLPYNGSWDEGVELYKLAMDANCQDYRIWFKLGMVVFEGGYFEEAFTSFEKMVELKAPGDYLFMALTWMGNICDAQGQREEAVKLYQKALPMAPEGDGWRHDQFGIKSSREWIEQRLQAPYNWRSIVKK